MTELKEKVSLEPQPVVSFDVDFGPNALAEGLVYDVDMQAVWQSLLTGGIAPEDIDKYPIIVGETNRLGHRGYFSPKSPDNDDKPAIVLLSYEGDGPISTTAIAHEARHLADYIEGNDHNSIKERRIRKVATTAIAALIIGALFTLNKDHGNSDDEIIKAGVGLLSLDVLVSYMYMLEYSLRKHEIRARRAAKQVVDKNVLIITKDGVEQDIKSDIRSHPISAFVSNLKAIFVPNFYI